MSVQRFLPPHCETSVKASLTAFLSLAVFRPRRASRQRGIALILVLWAMAVLALVLAQMVGDSRLESHAARLRLDTTRAQLAAQGGMAIAIAGLTALGPQRWAADGRSYRMALPGSQSNDETLAIQAWSEKGKVDLNTAPAATLRRLFICAGDAPSHAARLADNIQASRATSANSSGTPLAMPDALQQIPQMSNALYHAVAGAVTVWSGNIEPDVALATPLALCANPPSGMMSSMADAQTAVRRHWQRRIDMLGDAGPIIEIDSEAHLANGVTARIAAVVMLSVSDTTNVSALSTPSSTSVPYYILDWHET